MNKREFLAQLRETLSYDLPGDLVESNLRYYTSYIEEELRKGRTQEEILGELGDPKLIARSVIDAIKSGADGIPGTDDDLSFEGETYEEQTGGRNRGAFGGSFSGNDSAGSGSDAYQNGGTYREGGAYGSGNENRGTRGTQGREPGVFHEIRFGSGFGCLGIVIILILIMCVIGWLVGGVLALLSPILAPLCVIYLIYWLIKRLNGR
ncbi:MAG: DUF1700 domain-containing protein [Eubacteriales bacterium]|nr:DUF1700 domain-containing protein [Eubacteriales bacterium]